MAHHQKMSKSLGNVVTTDEVVHGVADLHPSCEFRDLHGAVIDDPRAVGVWRDVAGTGCYHAATRLGKWPVFLHERGNPVPALLNMGGEERVQHAGLMYAETWERPDGTEFTTETPVWEVIMARLDGDPEGRNLNRRLIRRSPPV